MNFDKFIQVPLLQKFSTMPEEFKRVVHEYFYDVLPLMIKDFKAVKGLTFNESLEAFEDLVEEGGMVFEKDRKDGVYRIYLFNLITEQYEDVTNLKDELTQSA